MNGTNQFPSAGGIWASVETQEAQVSVKFKVLTSTVQTAYLTTLLVYSLELEVTFVLSDHPGSWQGGTRPTYIRRMPPCNTTSKA